MIEISELHERINDRESSVDNVHWAISSNRKKDIHTTTAFRGLALYSLEIASRELQLNSVESARQWFARAAYAERSYVDIFAKHYD